jgi:UTP--glucose-1-phosphate uridylyltransferase
LSYEIGLQGKFFTAVLESYDVAQLCTVTGRYILQPEIFGILAAQKRGAGGEIQLTDAMIELAKTQPFYGLQFKGRSFDCGSKVGFLAANVAYALERDDIAPAMRAELKRLLGE